jgi:predicted metal-dependent hydrolase
MLSLSMTAGLEHLTALLARQILSDPQRRTGSMHPEMARLWRWHALEEAEHKAVAFDVLMQVAPGYSRRVVMMALNTFGLAMETLDRMVYMLWKDGLLFKARTWSGGWRFLFGAGGFLRGMGADYRAWYRRDFHPNEIDDRRLIELNAARIDAELAS